MKNVSIFGLLFFGVIGGFLSFSQAWADDSNAPTLANVHKTLLEAAGYQSDTPPTVDQQIDLLKKAAKMIEQIPHVYHGQLKAAAQDINAALSELSNGDPDHKAREDIFNADDEIKSIM